MLKIINGRLTYLDVASSGTEKVEKVLSIYTFSIRQHDIGLRGNRGPVFLFFMKDVPGGCYANVIMKFGGS